MFMIFYVKLKLLKNLGNMLRKIYDLELLYIGKKF